ncbi:MAG TPA: TIGR03435 family protein [Candidatus Angelobacter sp.]
MANSECNIKKSFFTATSVAAIAATLAFGLLPRLQAQAQSPQPAPTPSPSFEVASIKPNKADDQRMMFRMTPDGFSASGVPLKLLIEFAYNIKDFQISGGPGWIDSERYDIDAKMDEANIEAIKKMPRDQAVEQRRLMVQSLLADRFKLKVTHSNKELPIYALVVAKNGPKLVQAADTSSAPGGPGPQSQLRFTPGELSGTGIRMSGLANQLSREIGRKVVDKTGLQGNYDFTLHWTPDRPADGPGGPGSAGAPGDAPAPDSSGPSVFTALQEQLGLKLESQKGPVETLIIDSIEKPSEN